MAKSGFFTVEKRRGRWRLIAPDGAPFFSLGMNHIDSAGLRHPENIRLWQERYGNSHERWIRQAVAPDLRDWGFNTIGWAQEVVVRGPAMTRHSRNWTFEEYQWADMPYCHLLPFAEMHQWECETRHPDFFSPEFADWCDYVARDQCARMADDPKLIGYFYVDCPAWVHAPKPQFKGPLFDPGLLQTPAGRERLFELAGRYYEVTRQAVRRYDPNHLILGDRYEGKAPLPDEVLRAAAPHVDALSVQYFAKPEQIIPDFQRWHDLTGLPVLLADACAPGRTPGAASKEHIEAYAPMLRALRELPCCVGWHYCGAYIMNRCRKAGFRRESGEADEALAAAFRQANRETAQWVAQTASEA